MLSILEMLGSKKLRREVNRMARVENRNLYISPNQQLRRITFSLSEKRQLGDQFFIP
jgi:hypothetical protein